MKKKEKEKNVAFPAHTGVPTKKIFFDRLFGMVKGSFLRFIDFSRFSFFFTRDMRKCSRNIPFHL